MYNRLYQYLLSYKPLHKNSLVFKNPIPSNMQSLNLLINCVLTKMDVLQFQPDFSPQEKVEEAFLYIYRFFYRFHLR